MTQLTPLPNIILRPIVERALAEDFGNSGDVTARLLVPESASGSLVMRSRESGIIAGMQAAQMTYDLVDPNVNFEIVHPTGSEVDAKDIIARISGPSRSLLSAERVALNFLGRMSGVATLTSRYVKLVGETSTRIAATRKTTPGLRALEKQAVLAGGGFTHRESLSTAIMIKDNLEKVLVWGPDVVLLDNMGPEKLTEAVAVARKFDGRTPTLEASGGVNLQTVKDIAATGVDVISIGALTHSAPNFDIGMDDA